MSKIKFSKEEEKILVGKLQGFFDDELEQEIGHFSAGFLLDFISKEMGSYYYNRGLYDAQAILEARLDGVKDAIFDLEKRTGFVR